MKALSSEALYYPDCRIDGGNDEEGTLAGGQMHKKLLFSYSSTF